MSKTDNTVLKDMIITMLLYGIIAQIVCLIIPGDHLRMTAGLWIGVAAGVFMVIHMKNSLDEAVLYGEQEAQRYMQKSYAIRYLVVVVVFIAVSWLRIVNVLTLFAGIMSLKLERAFSIRENYRRLAIDCEFLTQTAEAMVGIAFIQIVLKRFF